MNNQNPQGNQSDPDFFGRVTKNSALYKRVKALERVALDETSRHYTAERLHKKPAEVQDAEAMIDYLIHHQEPIPKE